MLKNYPLYRYRSVKLCSDVGTLFSFRIGNVDAEMLRKEFSNTFSFALDEELG